ncbi:MAG: Phenylacetic acid degradation protein paaN, partial [Tardiphaga sp.]|nr:Phenylacetic acid degradation protein paaN [Tardiphaga sp.]
MKLDSFIRGRWSSAQGDLIDIASAVSGEIVARATSGGLDMREALAYARDTGGGNLRKLTFHQRADLLKRLGQTIGERKDQLYELSLLAGCTRHDAMIDVDGGIGALMVYAGKGRRELPNAKFLMD